MTDRRGEPPSGNNESPSDDGEPPPRGRRPIVVELAAALLIVTGLLQLLGALAVSGALEPGTEGLLALAVGLAVATIAAGVLTRAGRLWLLVVNYVAVLGFLDVLRAGSSPLALMLAIVDVFALYVLFTNRPWFQRPEVEPVGPEE